MKKLLTISLLALLVGGCNREFNPYEKPLVVKFVTYRDKSICVIEAHSTNYFPMVIQFEDSIGKWNIGDTIHFRNQPQP